MKKLLIIISTLLNVNLSAQQKTVGVQFMPYTLMDYSPRVRIGVFYKAGNKMAYELDFGLGNLLLNKRRVDDLNLGTAYHFYELRPEIKYYFNKADAFNSYISAEFFAIFLTNTFYNRYYHSEKSDLYIQYDRADFVKQKYGLHLKCGIELIAWKFLIVDFYFGLGSAYRNINYKNIKNPQEIGEFIFEEWWGHAYKYEGKSIIFHLTFGLNIGLQLVLKTHKK